MVGIDKLKTKIIQKKAKIAVIGLGYVGLPLACLFADAGFSVVGIDLDKQRIKKVNQGLSPIAGKEPGLDDLVKRVVTSGKLNTSDDYAYLKDVDVVLIAVQTPIKKSHQPDYGALKVVLSSLGPVLKDGSLIIVESTLSPGTMQNFVLPILEKYSAKRQGVDFYLGHCPERVMPGKLLMKLRNMPRVVGGRNPQISDVMVALYKHIVVGDLDVTDWITAELVKTTENAYRDVQIAFANEVAIICEKLGGNVWKVRELINKIPERNMLLPGAGVGGHCIPKDPWLLYSSAVEANATPRLINAAREVNDGMPMHVLDMLENAQDIDDIVVRVEADDTHDPKYILDLINKLEKGYDVVNTSRFQPGGGQIGVSRYRAFVSRAANYFMRFIFGMKNVRDFSCGFRAYRAQIVKDALEIFGNQLVQLKGLGFTSTLELIVKLHLMGCRFAEMPFVLRYDQKEGQSKMVGSVTTLGYLIMALLYWWPFGGWKSHYRGLGELYRSDRKKAIKKFKMGLNKHRHLPTKINT